MPDELRKLMQESVHRPLRGMDLRKLVPTSLTIRIVWVSVTTAPRTPLKVFQFLNAAVAGVSGVDMVLCGGNVRVLAR